MGRRILLLTSMILALVTLSACSNSTLGPSTWIDQPLDGTHAPLAALTIMAHASDADGVATIEFFLSEELLRAIGAGGGRLGQASMEWTPPGPGVYDIVARAIDELGNYGSQASALITVGDIPATVAPTPVPEQVLTSTPTALLTATPTPTPSGPSFTLAQNANCRAGPGTAYEALEVLLNGLTVPIEGRNQDSSWFWVAEPTGSGHCWISAVAGQVHGDMSQVQIVSAPPLPQPDSIPPDIAAIGTRPASLQKAGCGEPSTTLASATVNDAGGVSRVVARILGYGEVEMTPVGGQVYQAVLGPFSEMGEYSIIFLAWDNAGNSAQAGPLSVTVVCIN
jgi:Bacterial Ig domain